jgi:predicted SAM-dependent methyltransferase
MADIPTLLNLLKGGNTTVQCEANRSTDLQNGQESTEGIETISCLYCGHNIATRVRQIADIVSCDACMLVYLRTRPTHKKMYEIYQEYAHDTSHMRPPASVDEAGKHGLRREWFVEEVQTWLKGKKGRWMDVGCGWGALLMYAQECGFAPCGIEMTRINLDFAAMHLGIPVSNSQFTDSVIPARSCIVLTMVHVLEHIPNPKETLEKIYKTLEPGGVFCGIVPNFGSYCSEIQNENWVWLDPIHHYVQCTPETLRAKLSATGFEILNIYTAIGDYHDEFTTLLQQVHLGQDAESLSQLRVQIEQQGRGEEIRFFVRRPF